MAWSGCSVFIVHARNAWLDGLSPKDNREIPPLRYEIVHRLKREFPRLTIAINGGIKDDATIAEQLAQVDGVMVGRHAYHEPWSMATWDERFFGEAPSGLTREGVEDAWIAHLETLWARGAVQVLLGAVVGVRELHQHALGQAAVQVQAHGVPP